MNILNGLEVFRKAIGNKATILYFEVFLVICKNEGIFYIDLANYIDMSPSQLRKDTINFINVHELFQREYDPLNQTKVRLRLSRKGKELKHEVYNAMGIPH